jgi:hypothetical protein
LRKDPANDHIGEVSHLHNDFNDSNKAIFGAYGDPGIMQIAVFHKLKFKFIFDLYRILVFFRVDFAIYRMISG